MNIQRIKEIINKWTSERIFPGVSIRMQKSGSLLLEYAAGYADLEREILATVNNIWVAASIAKPVAAVALMQMVDREEVDLNQSVTELLPDFYHDHVLLRHLLTHASGLGPMEPQEEAIRQRGRIRAIADQGLLFEPGTKCSYTTPALDLVEQIVCEKSGMNWVEYTKTNIFDPLAMHETSFHPGADWSDRIPRVYDASDQLDPWWNNRYLRAIGLAGGGLFTTLKDLSAFAESFLNEGGPILSRKSCNEMLTVQTRGLLNFEGHPQTWGLGWYLNQDGGTGFGPLSSRAFGHGGATGTWICIDPEQELIVVKLANRLGVTLEDGSRMQSELLTELL